MILDSLSHSQSYESLSPAFAKAFQWLRSVDPPTLPEGRCEIDGPLHAMVFRNAVKPMGKTKWEAHRRYADIHCVFTGREAMFWESLGLTETGIYEEDRDFLPLEAESWVDIEVPAGQFVVFLPGDAHRVGIEIPGVEPVLKVVVKVPL